MDFPLPAPKRTISSHPYTHATLLFFSILSSRSNSPSFNLSLSFSLYDTLTHLLPLLSPLSFSPFCQPFITHFSTHTPFLLNYLLLFLFQRPLYYVHHFPSERLPLSRPPFPHSDPCLPVASHQPTKSLTFRSFDATL